LVKLAEPPSHVEPESSPFCRPYQMPRLTRRGAGINIIKKLIVPGGVAGRMEMIRQMLCIKDAIQDKTKKATLFLEIVVVADKFQKGEVAK